MIHIAPTNKVFVNMTALRHNFREVKQLAGNRRIMAVIKGDGYGHGLLPSAQTLAQAGADALGLVEVADGLLLRDHGLDLPIYLLGGLSGPEQLEPVIRQGLSVFAASPEEVRALSRKGAELGLRAKLHLKVDTGLGRRGFDQAEVEAFLLEAANWPSLEIEGLATHLASSGDPEAVAQLELFDALCAKAGHLMAGGSLNTALDSLGLICHGGHLAPMVRVGLMLYGVHPGPDLGPCRPDLRPAMTILSRLTHLHRLEPGETVGPGRTYVVRRPTLAAVAPFGYAQGLMRSGSGRGWVLIRGQRAPRIGLIDMNSSIYDVTDIKNVSLGDNVVILGRHSTESINASDLAAWAVTTPHEILTLLGRLNPRHIEGSDYEEEPL